MPKKHVNTTKELYAKEVFLSAVRQDGFREFPDAAEELRSDKEAVLGAVRNHGDALGYAVKELRADKEVVLAAVQQNSHALKYVAEELQADKDIVLAAEQNN